jgi:hypothetical protein
MSQAEQDTSPLLPQQAFLVQFREATGLEPKLWKGRVEHVVSGRGTPFQSFEELRRFVAAVLGELPEPPTRSSRKTSRTGR